MPTRTEAPDTRAARRSRAAALLCLVVVLGVALQAVRDRVPGGDLAGTILWTVAVACVVRAVVPGAGARTVAGVATSAGVLVELAQLTPWPRDAAAAFGPARLVLGTSFAAADLLGYVLGGLLAWGVLRWTDGPDSPTD
ncbi:DUF2809 domain-containing protein [Luteimicrobium subarcticum]|uniref:Uncharacterized protein DUF2809 n=1 Tax=Luteimicrobium subarcticum TaxID=620910 RepID=A0A2M8WR95_9MICO|nr:DUF2809 domain-containing protein [Luteimicrobium subarcticum]PJI93438.1 uncharacterized protein DUF2809 [Luteimicrobium subarcticum]